MTSASLPFALIAAHFVGDWYFQWPKMAENKSKDPAVLAKHIGIVSITLFIFLISLVPLGSLIWKLVVNALLHAIIDWNIWRIYRKHFSLDSLGNAINPINDVWFWKFIASDQFAHIAILFLLFL